MASYSKINDFVLAEIEMLLVKIDHVIYIYIYVCMDGWHLFKKKCFCNPGAGPLLNILNYSKCFELEP